MKWPRVERGPYPRRPKCCRMCRPPTSRAAGCDDTLFPAAQLDRARPQARPADPGGGGTGRRLGPDDRAALLALDHPASGRPCGAFGGADRGPRGLSSTPAQVALGSLPRLFGRKRTRSSWVARRQKLASHLNNPNNGFRPRAVCESLPVSTILASTAPSRRRRWRSCCTCGSGSVPPEPLVECLDRSRRANEPARFRGRRRTGSTASKWRRRSSRLGE